MSLGINVELLPSSFVMENGKFDKAKAMNFCGKIAGVCYDEEGYDHLANESEEKTNKRIDRTLNSGHHSVYDHVIINLNIQNIPKALAMVLNNEKCYVTSEKSARYTSIVRQEGSVITLREEELYNKWLDIFEARIDSYYGNTLNNTKVTRLAQENARYLVTVFMPTQMIYSVSLRQINYLTSWMLKYIKSVKQAEVTNNYEFKMAEAMYRFICQLYKLDVIEDKLLNNEKQRSLSLFGDNLLQKEVFFGDLYQTVYSGSFAQLAQAQRHRTLNYQMELLEDNQYFVPPILDSDPILIQEWLYDMKSVKDVYPQGQLVRICESGTYEKFIEKCKERLCSSAQLEVMVQTRNNLLAYKDALRNTGSPLFDDCLLHCKGARCTFPDYSCQQNCKFNAGKTLTRRI